uniref:Transposase n=1 Tax=Panagrellus redivivus TaxID=6233 RepID=A0A7E4UU47_PANRE
MRKPINLAATRKLTSVAALVGDEPSVARVAVFVQHRATNHCAKLTTGCKRSGRDYLAEVARRRKLWP